MASIIRELLHLIRRATTPTSFLLVGLVDRLLVLRLRALENTTTLLVAIEAKFMLFVSLTLLSGKK
jgi:hypothetical protein